MPQPPPANDINKMFADAVNHLQQGNFPAACSGFERVVARAPDNPVALHHLAMANMHLGRFPAALKVYRELHGSNPGDPETLTNFGLCYQETGELGLAMSTAHRALEMAPQHPRATNLLGTIHGARGEPGQAAFHFRKVLEMDDRNPDVRLNLASALQQNNEPREALQVLAPLLGTDAPDAALQLAGQVMVDNKNIDGLSGIVDRLARSDPNSYKTGLLTMSLWELQKLHTQVIDTATKLLAEKPRDHIVLHSLGQARYLSGQTEAAIQSFEQAIEIAPDVAKYHNSLGLAHASRGDKIAAETCYRDAILLEPRFGEAYRSLAALKTFESDKDPDLALLQSAWDDPGISEPARCKVAFALGKAHDDYGNYDKAFAAYRAGNDIMADGHTGGTTDAHIARFSRTIEVLSSPPESTAEKPLPSARPLFIVGMPRSGTTLVEQILSGSNEVTACGELPGLEQCVVALRESGIAGQFPDGFTQITTAQLSLQASAYLASASRHKTLSTRLFTDKMPINFRYVWLIRAMFPDSDIIYCKRHPLDIVLSNYFQLYGAATMDFTYRLNDLARYYVAYHRLMIHWQKLFQNTLHTVQYETLVTDNRETVEKLIAYVGLPWNDCFLQHQHSAATVRTASIWQVRQGIYTRSVARWQHYRQQLAPAIDVLKRANVLDNDLREI